MRKKEITKEMPQTAIEITSTFFSIGEFVDIRFIYFCIFTRVFRFHSHHFTLRRQQTSFLLKEKAASIISRLKSFFLLIFCKQKKKKKKKRSLKRILFIKIDVSF